MSAPRRYWHGDIYDLFNITVPELNQNTWLEYVNSRGDSWAGGSTTQIEKDLKGLSDYDMTDTVLNYVDKMKIPKLPSVRRKPVWRKENGSSVKVSALLQGSLIWRSTKIESTKRLTRGGKVTIFADLGSHAGISTQEFKWRGVAALALTTALERAGRRVELYAGVICVGHAPERMVMLLKLKDFGQRANKRLLSAVLTHVGMYRHYVFKCILNTHKKCYGFGSPKRFTNEDFGSFVKEKDIIKITDCFSESSMLKYVEEMVASMGESK